MALETIFHQIQMHFQLLKMMMEQVMQTFSIRILDALSLRNDRSFIKPS